MNVVFYSNFTRNTERFVAKLGLEAVRIEDGIPDHSVLITPTYGNAAVPKPVIRALNTGPRHNIHAIIGTGNVNFGVNYCAAGHILSNKLGVPLLNTLELAGTSDDVEKTLYLLERFINDSIGNVKGVSLLV